MENGVLTGCWDKVTAAQRVRSHAKAARRALSRGSEFRYNGAYEKTKLVECSDAGPRGGGAAVLSRSL